jgi:hypothetical protein
MIGVPCKMYFEDSHARALLTFPDSTMAYYPYNPFSRGLLKISIGLEYRFADTRGLFCCNLSVV